MQRIVQPEILDELPPEHSLAIGSRCDLVRLNRIMGNVGIFHRHFRRTFPERPPRRIVELGSGDGTFLLRLAQRFGSDWSGADVTLVDRQPVVSGATLGGFTGMGWSAQVASADVFAWLEQQQEPCDLMLANLFLHHFEAKALRRLLGLIASRSMNFVACEPRRGSFGLMSARLSWLIGCNSVTRHDVVVSVRAGFAGRELTDHWPGGAGVVRERAAGAFSHFFAAARS